MERMTRKRADGAATVAAELVEVCDDGSVGGAAIERLAALEEAIEVVEKQLASTVGRLDELKAAGRARGSSAQQLLAQKVTYATLLHLMGADRA